MIFRIIMRSAFPLLACLSAILTPVSSAVAQQAVAPRAVVELFTSQGCSSCPPADKLMAELSKDPSLIILTLPVDYWDYLGWKDTLADAAFSYRQRAYSGMRGDRQVYTPQAVINGVAHAVGSDRAQIEKVAAQTRKSADALSLSIAITAKDGSLTVACPDRMADSGVAHVWALPFHKERTVQIGRGENSGRSVTYVNVAHSVSRIGECRASGGSVVIPAAGIPADADGVVVLLQAGSDKKPSRILAATRHLTR